MGALLACRRMVVSLAEVGAELQAREAFAAFEGLVDEAACRREISEHDEEILLTGLPVLA